MPDLRDLYDEYARGGEVPEQFSYWSSNTAFGTYFGRRCKFSLRYHLWPSMYMCLVAPSATARKSTAAEDATEILELAIDGEEDVDETVPLLIYEPTRAAMLATMGKATEEYGTTPPLLLYNDEARNIFADPAFVGLLDSLYTRRRYKRETKGNGVDDLIDQAVSILTCTTPTWLGSAMDQYGFGEGTMGRFLFVYAEDRTCKIAWPFQSDEREKLKMRIVEEVRKLRTLAGNISIEKSAQNKFQVWYENYSPQDHAVRVSGWEARMHTHVLKTASTTAMLRRQELHVRLSDLEEAFERVTAVEKSLWAVHRNVLIDGEIREIKVIETAVRDAGPGGIKHSPLRNKVVRKVGGKLFDETIQHLTAANTIHEIPIEGSGRPGRKYIHADFINGKEKP